MNRREFLKVTAAPGLALGAASMPVNLLLAGPPMAQPDSPPAKLDQAAAGRALAEHKIAKLESRTLADVFLHSVGPNSRGAPQGSGSAEKCLLITTDRGVIGWSTSGGSKEAEFPKLVGRNVGELFDVETGLADGNPWWLDRPLHDLAGQILGRPVCDIFGAKGDKEVLIYDGSVYFEDLMPKDKPSGVEGLLKVCQLSFDAGYRAFKLKIGRGAKWMPAAEGHKRDIEVTRAVRERFKDCKILVDANDSYSVQQAIDYVKGVADCDLYWIEEPFEENADDLTRLREAMAKAACKAMITDGESGSPKFTEKSGKYGGYADKFIARLYSLGEQKLVDVANMDLDTLGYSRWRRVMPEVAHAGLRASPHTWRWALRTYYAAHLAAGLGNSAALESIPCTIKGLDRSGYTMKDGKLVLPPNPGFGLKLT